MSKKTLRIVLATAAAAALALTSACSNGGGSDEGGDEGGESKGKIALAMSHMTNAFVTTVADAAVAEGEALGYEVVVFDGTQDASTQVGQIEQAVSQGFDGILVEPVSKDGVMPGLIAANDAGVPIATIVQQAEDQSLAATYIGGNETAAGKLQMEEAIKAIDGEGDIGVLFGPMGSDAQIARDAGYQEAIEAAPDVEVTNEQSANWVTDEALTTVENWLSAGADLKAIVAQNDGMAVGAAQAITNAGKTGEILVFGIDATDDGIAAIEAGDMAGTVSQDTPGIGRLGVETMVKIIDGEEVEPEVLTTAVWITADNIGDLG